MADPLNVEERLPSEAAKQHLPESEISLKERFFRYFQHEITGSFSSYHRIELKPAFEVDPILSDQQWLSSLARADGKDRGYLASRWGTFRCD